MPKNSAEPGMTTYDQPPLAPLFTTVAVNSLSSAVTCGHCDPASAIASDSSASVVGAPGFGVAIDQLWPKGSCTTP